MTHGIKASITRVRSADGRVAGAGFLVADRLVLTCAHVVNLALGRHAAVADRPDDPVLLDFPLLAGPTAVVQPGAVLRWLPIVASGDGDVAVLQLAGDPPVGAAPAVLVQADEPWGHRFRVCGFPVGYDSGDWASGRLLEGQATRWLQVEDDKATGHWVQAGFSGAPVWDEELSGIVGMAVAADRHRDTKVAYVLPTALLTEACPELDERRTLPCPYRGLAAFRERDAALFFGREAAVARLRDAARRLELVTLVGASGSGKSSVLFAGLLPTLAPEGPVVAVFRPGKDPFSAIAASLLPILAPELSRAELLLETPKLAEVVRQGRLDQVIGQLTAGESRAVVLVGDQLEELFTLCPDAEARRLFLDSILAALALPRRERATMLVTLRADFYGQALTHRGLAEALQAGSVLLGPMTREELRKAIETPARARGVSFEPGLVDRILGEVAEEPGCLPLLEFTLTLLWEKQAARRLTHQAYEELGGVEGAIARYADPVLAELDPGERERARRVFVQLVNPGEATEDTRRLATRTELDLADWALAQRLADERLVVTDRDATGRETAEVVHEALIKAWPTLRSWMDEDREFRTWQERVRDVMEVWRTSGDDGTGRDPELLLRGSAIEQALRWLTERRCDLHSSLVEFIRLSEQTQQRRLDRDRRRVRLLGLLLVLAVILAAFAGLQVNRARQQTQLALSRYLAARALSDVGTNLPRSLLLSVEALHLRDTTEARSALLTGLQSSPNLLSYLPTNAGTPFGVAFSPDGNMLAAGAENGNVLLWNPRSREQLGEPLVGQGSWVKSVAFSPNSRILASGSSDNSIILWDVGSHRRLGHPFLAHHRAVTSVAFSPDGSTLASASEDHTVRLWDLRTHRPLGGPLIGHTGAVNGVAFSPDGGILASAGDDAEMILWDVRRHQRRGHPLVGQTKAVTSVAFGPRGAIVASASEDHTVRLWDVSTYRPLGAPLNGHRSPIWGVAFSPDGNTMATGAGDNSVRLWDIRRRRQLGDALTGHGSFVLGIAFSPDGRMLASASDDHTVGLWNVHPSVPLGKPLLDTDSPVLSVAFSPDGKILASGDDNGVVLWSVDTGNRRRLGDGVTAPNGPVWSVAFSADGTTLASGTEDGAIYLWNVRTGGRLGSPLLGHHDTVESVAFSPDGRILASGSNDHAVIFWDLRQTNRRQPLTGHHDIVNAVAFSPNGSVLASASDDNTVILWDVRSRRPMKNRIKGSRDWRSVAFSPDGSALALGSGDNTVTLWDPQTHQRLGEPFTGHTNWINSVAFSPDRRTLASASADHTVILWDTGTHQRIGEPLPASDDDSVWSVAFDPTGTVLASGSQDGKLVLWDTSVKSWVQQACLRANTNLSPGEWRQFLEDRQYVPTCSHRL